MSQRLGCWQHPAFVVDDNVPILSTPLASDILTLSQTIYLTLCSIVGTLSHMSSHAAEFPAPKSAYQAVFLAWRFERRPTGPVKNVPFASKLPPLRGVLLSTLYFFGFSSIHHTVIIEDEANCPRLERMPQVVNSSEKTL